LAATRRCANLDRDDVILRSEAMGQLGFFDADRRLAALSEKGDPLEAIAALIPWESFRADIEAVVLTPEEAKKSKAGRKPFDAMVMFRMLVLQSLYNLSDEQIEYQVRDRLSFTRFLGRGVENDIPDGTTLWLFREKLARAGLIATLFDRFDQHLNAKGYIARGGQMVDASIVPVPKQRNTREENEAVKRGEGSLMQPLLDRAQSVAPHGFGNTVLIDSRKRICCGLKIPRCGLMSGMRSPAKTNPGFNSFAVR